MHNSAVCLQDVMSVSSPIPQNIKLECPLSIIPLTLITGEETNLAELLATGHICEMDESLTADVRVSVYRAVLAGDGSLINRLWLFLSILHYSRKGNFN